MGVDQTRSQGLFLAGTTFALEEATGDLSHRIGFLDVMHASGKKVACPGCSFFCNDGTQTRRVFYCYQYGTVA